MKALERAALQVTRNNEGPQERYNRRMGELAALVKSGALSMGQAEAAALRYGGQLDNAGRAGEKAFGAGLLSKIGTATAGYLSMGAAVGGISQALRKMEADAIASADNVLNALGQIGELQQLGPEGFASNLAFVRDLVRRGVVGKDEIGRAADISFAATSAGLSDQEKELLAHIGEQQFVKAENLVGFTSNIKKLQNIFGTGEAGDLENVVKKVTATSQGTFVSASQTAQNVLKFAPLAKSLGFSDEESLAAFIATEGQAASAEAGAEQIKSLLAQVSKRGLGKGSFAKTVEGIRSRIQGGEQVFDVLGEQNAVLGFQLLENQLDKLRTDAARITSAQTDDTFARSLGLLETDVGTRSALRRRRAEGGLSATRESGQAAQRNLFEAAMAERQQRLEEEGRTLAGAFNQFQRSTAFQFELPMVLERLQNDPLVAPETRQAIEDLLGQQISQQERQIRALESIDRKLDGNRVRPSGRQE